VAARYKNGIESDGDSFVVFFVWFLLGLVVFLCGSSGDWVLFDFYGSFSLGGC